MAAVRVAPVPLLRGTLQVPSDKSLTHRALMLAAVSDRPVRIGRPLDSEDTGATLAAVEACGAAVDGPPRRRADRGGEGPARAAPAPRHRLRERRHPDAPDRRPPGGAAGRPRRAGRRRLPAPAPHDPHRPPAARDGRRGLHRPGRDPAGGGQRAGRAARDRAPPGGRERPGQELHPARRALRRGHDLGVRAGPLAGPHRADARGGRRPPAARGRRRRPGGPGRRARAARRRGAGRLLVGGGPPRGGRPAGRPRGAARAASTSTPAAPACWA